VEASGGEGPLAPNKGCKVADGAKSGCAVAVASRGEGPLALKKGCKVAEGAKSGCAMVVACAGALEACAGARNVGGACEGERERKTCTFGVGEDWSASVAVGLPVAVGSPEDAE